MNRKSGNKLSLNLIALRFIKDLTQFEYDYELDKNWNVIFNNAKAEWYYLNVTKYEGMYFVTNLMNRETIRIDSLKKEVLQNQSVFQEAYSEVIDKNQWIITFDLAVKWLLQTKKNWVKQNKVVMDKFPFKYRKGIVPASIVDHLFPKFTSLQKQIGIRSSKKMIEVIESGYFRNEDNISTTKLTANAFFEYCKLAYKAVGIGNSESTGKELYETYADGRHEGLLDINLNSEKEFADWIDGKHKKRQRGGHPWEILRGGNSSNVQLSVRRPLYGSAVGYIVEVYATGVSRLAESIKIFLKVYHSKLPITIAQPDFIRDQLCLKDNYGLIPEFGSLHRANQQFAKSDKVNNVLYFSDIKSKQSHILPYINWNPLPLLVPKNLH